MTTRAEATAAPMPLELDGTEYLLSPLTERDAGELDNWVRAEIMRRARATLDEDATPAQRELTERIAWDTARNITWSSPEGLEIIFSTVRGLARLIWQSARHTHEGLTVDDVCAHLGSEANIQAAQAVFGDVNNGGKKKVTKKRKPRKSIRKKRQTRSTGST